MCVTDAGRPYRTTRLCRSGIRGVTCRPSAKRLRRAEPCASCPVDTPCCAARSPVATSSDRFPPEPTPCRGLPRIGTSTPSPPIAPGPRPRLERVVIPSENLRGSFRKPSQLLNEDQKSFMAPSRRIASRLLNDSLPSCLGWWRRCRGLQGGGAPFPPSADSAAKSPTSS